MYVDLAGFLQRLCQSRSCCLENQSFVLSESGPVCLNSWLNSIVKLCCSETESGPDGMKGSDTLRLQANVANNSTDSLLWVTQDA